MHLNWASAQYPARNIAPDGAVRPVIAAIVDCRPQFRAEAHLNAMFDDM